MSQENYRAYFFQNMYLPGIHAGVQSQHTTVEMFVKYQVTDDNYLEDLPELDILYTWANEDKTTIVLNGGMSGQLQELIDLFSDEDNPYPWAYFHETEFALGGALTNVGVILPERIYTYDQIVREFKKIKESGYTPVFNIPKLTDFEMRIVEVLRGKRLMQ